MELIISFLLGFVATWFLTRENVPTIKTSVCPQKETISQLIRTYPNDKRLKREIKEYSLIKIQEGHYEYAEVLTTLTEKEAA